MFNKIQGQKALTIFLVLLLMMQSWPMSFQAAEEKLFSDVVSHEKEVQEMVELGIIHGYPNQTFKPGASITRLQAVLMIAREMNLNTANRPNPHFTDIKPGMRHYAIIAAAADQGIISGKSNGKFDPEGLLTRGQMASILVRAYQLTGQSTNYFTDVPKNYWAYTYIQTLRANNMATGYEDGTFQPEGFLTRMHFVLFLSRYIHEVKEFQEEAFENDFHLQTDKSSVLYGESAQLNLIVSNKGLNYTVSWEASGGKLTVAKGQGSAKWQSEENSSKNYSVKAIIKINSSSKKSVTIEKTINLSSVAQQSSGGGNNGGNSGPVPAPPISTSYTASFQLLKDWYVPGETVTINGFLKNNLNQPVVNKKIEAGEAGTATTNAQGAYSLSFSAPSQSFDFSFSVEGKPVTITDQNDQVTNTIAVSVGTEDVRMQASVELLEKETMNEVSEIIEGEKIVFNGQPEELTDLKAGTVFTTAPLEEFPLGLAGKVETIEISGGQTIVHITEPKLTELFSQLDLEGTANLNAEHVTPDEGVTMTVIPKQEAGEIKAASSMTLGNDLSFAFTKSLVYGKGEKIKLGNLQSSYRGEAEGTFNVEFLLKSPVLTYDVNIASDYAKLELLNEQELKAELTGKLNGELETKYRIAKILIPVHGAIGVSGSIWAVTSATGEVTFEISATETATLKTGIEASKNGVSLVEYDKPFDVKIDVVPFDIQGKAETKVGIQPTLFITAFTVDIVGVSSEAGYGNILEGTQGKDEFDGKVCLKGNDRWYIDMSADLEFPVQESINFLSLEKVVLERDDCPTLENIELEYKHLLLEKGAELDLEVTGVYADKSTRNVSKATDGTTYKSSNEKAIKIDENGKMTVLADAEIGAEVTVTVKKGDKEASTVIKVIEIESLAIEPQNIQMAPGTSKQLTVTAKMTNGESLNLSDWKHEIDYKVENEIIAQVTKDGKVFVPEEIISGIPPTELTAVFRGYTATASLSVTAGEGEQQGLSLPAKSPVTAGYQHSLFLQSNGTVWAWGNNNRGQLGNGATATNAVPEKVAGLTDVIAVDAGFYFNLALRKDGTIWAWGDNRNGQLGNSTNIDSSVPVQVKGIEHAVSIAAGQSTAYAILSDGSVMAWGYGGRGNLGNGQTYSSTVPVEVQGLKNVVSIDSSLNVFGELHTVALRGDQTVWAWGAGYFGAIGAGEEGNTFYSKTYASPVQVVGADKQPLTGITAIAAGDIHSIALHETGTVYGWGNGWGQDFFDSNNHAVLKKEADGQTNLSNVKWISAGGFQENVVVKMDGTVWTWTGGKAPVQVKNVSNVKMTATGGFHSLAVAQDGKIWSWGWNDYGQLGKENPVENPVQVSW